MPAGVTAGGHGGGGGRRGGGDTSESEGEIGAWARGGVVLFVFCRRIC